MDPLEHRLSEAFDALWNCFVDPHEANMDHEGMWWNTVSADGKTDPDTQAPFATEEQLADIRGQCRQLAATNAYAINGLENRISYLVGSGHIYRASVRKGADAPADLVMDVQTVIDQFLHVNRWNARQQEVSAL